MSSIAEHGTSSRAPRAPRAAHSGAPRGSWLASLLPRSIVGRTTLAILALSAALGILFAAAVSSLVQANEQRRLETHLEELVSTVESTVRVACFVGDRNLAHEVAEGLLSNRSVAAVRITAGATTLEQRSRSRAMPRADGATRVITRPISSPFDPRQTVGEISLYASVAELRSEAWAYTRFTLIVLAAQAALIAATVACIVFFLVTRPVKGISDELHRLEVRTGMQLRVPNRNESDEIGRLVTDVNSLIARLSGLVQTEHELRLAHEQSERRLRLVFDKAETGLFVIDAQGMLQSCNPAFVRILGLPLRPSATEHPRQLQSLLGADGLTADELIAQSLATGEPRDTDLQLAKAESGAAKWIELTINPIGPNLLQGIVNDISERKRAEAAAQRLASQDTLTGLLNRRGIDAALQALPSAAACDASPVALLQIDLDLFKSVNDTHGHEAGDRVLCSVARALESAVRRGDVVGRLGGDEFVVLLTAVDGLSALDGVGTATKVAEHIIASVSRPIDLGDGRTARVGASIGIALREPADTPEALLRRADAAMYSAKRAGGGAVRIAAPSQRSIASA